MRTSLSRPSQSLWKIFRWPLALGFISLVGLVAALVADGLADALSWLCLGSLPLMAVWLYRK